MELKTTHEDRYHITTGPQIMIQRQMLDKIFLILKHPFVHELRQDLRRKGDSDNVIKPWQDPMISVDAVLKEMEVFTKLCAQLTMYFEMPSVPSEFLVASSDKDVQKNFLALLQRHINFSRNGVLSSADENSARSILLQAARQCPLKFDQLQALSDNDSQTAIRWKQFGCSLADRCEEIVDFVVNNIKALQPRRRREAAVIAQSLQPVLDSIQLANF